MANPTVPDARAIARLCRFLKGLPRMVQRIPFEDRPPTLIEPMSLATGLAAEEAGSPPLGGSSTLEE